MVSIKLMNGKIFKKVKENTFKIETEEHCEEVSMNQILEKY